MLGWATGNLPEPRNNPQVGMANMRTIMPALQRAKPAPLPSAGLCFASVSLPKQQRETRIVKDMPAEEIAREIVAWIEGGITWKRSAAGPHRSRRQPGQAGAGSLTAALALGGELTVGLVGANVQPAADQIAGAGAARILAVSGEAFAAARYATDAAAAEALARASGAALVLAPATSRWARALPGVAYRLGGRVDTHATESADAERRPRRHPLVLPPAHGSRAHAHPAALVRAARCRLFEPWTGDAGSRHGGTGGRRSSGHPHHGHRHAGAQRPTSRPSGPTPSCCSWPAPAGPRSRPTARYTAAEAESLILGFLRAAKASLGGSKSLVDLSGEGEAVLRFMTHLNQVGQTGATPRHPKGLSTCCHGEEPHVVGWRFITERRAINLDPNCGWARGKADVLYVADAFEVMREVNRLMA